jgi:hypothetical protein
MIPEEFYKIIKDFVSDIVVTFPEYKPIINKWWNLDGNNNTEKDREKLVYIYKHCLNVFSERFFDILNQNNEIFEEKSIINTEFLPGISFKYLWNCDISDKTRETIWKYLQLIVICIVKNSYSNSVKDDADADADADADTSNNINSDEVDDRENNESEEELPNMDKIFESINDEEFKNKLQETLENMQSVFSTFENNGPKTAANERRNSGEEDDTTQSTINIDKEDFLNPNANPNANANANANATSENKNENEYLHESLNSMMGGKLGEIAKEIAEETANSMNIDMNGVTDINGVLSSLLKNPAKLMNMVKDIGGKLDEKMKSGDLNEGELFSEASEIMQKMKNIPGMDNIQDMMSKMGMNPSLKKNVSKTKFSNNSNNRFNSRQQQQMLQMMQQMQHQTQPSLPNYSNVPPLQPALTDDELASIFSENKSTENKEQKKEKSDKKKKSNKK